MKLLEAISKPKKKQKTNKPQPTQDMVSLRNKVKLQNSLLKNIPWLLRVYMGSNTIEHIC